MQTHRLPRIRVLVPNSASELCTFGEELSLLYDPSIAVSEALGLAHDPTLRIELALGKCDDLASDSTRPDYIAKLRLSFRCGNRALQVLTPEDLLAAIRQDLCEVRCILVLSKLVVRLTMCDQAPHHQSPPAAATTG
ncbi:MAG: hypothetical protein ACREV7_16230 [Steroidobacteraceae bacterium]